MHATKLIAALSILLVTPVAQAFTLSQGDEQDSGQILTVQNESVELRVVAGAAAFNDEFVWDTTAPGRSFFCRDEEQGDTISLGTYTDATVLDFSLRTPSRDLWVTGAGTYNPDGLAHARLEQTDEYTVRLGFEDLAGGGDLDYDDCLVDLIITPR